jgi:hypothetical protein
MAAAGQIEDFFRTALQTRLAGRIGQNDNPVGVADVETIADQCHAKGHVQAAQKALPQIGSAALSTVAQQNDSAL